MITKAHIDTLAQKGGIYQDLRAVWSIPLMLSHKQLDCGSDGNQRRSDLCVAGLIDAYGLISNELIDIAMKH